LAPRAHLLWSYRSVPKHRLSMAVPPSDKIVVTSHQQYVTPDQLSPATVAPSPLDQFRTWFTAVSQNDIVKEPEAMSLSTATSSGIPSARFVLFKQLDSRGFIFFTNYTSRKSKEMLENPRAALVFYWREVHRSVRVLGMVEKVSEEESEAYYRSRPLDSRLGGLGEQAKHGRWRRRGAFQASAGAGTLSSP